MKGEDAVSPQSFYHNVGKTTVLVFEMTIKNYCLDIPGISDNMLVPVFA